jgi:VWFA-related protein
MATWTLPAAMLAPWLWLAQTTQSVPASWDDPIRMDVQVVRIPCSVTDRKGLPANYLAAKDFSIRDNGVSRKVRYFARETDLPLTVGLLVDVSGSQRQFLTRHRRALAQFFRNILKPGDRVFIAALERDVRLIQDFTGSAEELDAAIDRVKPREGDPMGQPCPAREIQLHNRVIRVPRCGGSVIWDGVYYASEKLRGVDGRKALIVMTDGEDTGSPHSLEQAIGMAQAAETVVFPIKAVTRRKLSDAIKKPLENLAELSGGLSFDGVKQKDPNAIFTRIETELRTMYMLGFHIDGPRDGKFHELKVTASGGHKVRTRSGYWATAAGVTE